MIEGAVVDNIETKDTMSGGRVIQRAQRRLAMERRQMNMKGSELNPGELAVGRPGRRQIGKENNEGTWR